MRQPGVPQRVDSDVKATDRAQGRPGAIARFFQQEDLNFLLTNRVPRIALTRLMGRVSRIRSRAFTRLAIALWRQFTTLDLSDARRTSFDSLHECFTRELQPGARPFDPRVEVLASPCDAIVGACGTVEGTRVFQAKGFRTRSTSCSARARTARRSATASTRRCASPRRCITASTRRTTPPSST